jgi:hypothetical protein
MRSSVVIILVGMYVYRRSRLDIGLDGFLLGVKRVDLGLQLHVGTGKRRFIEERVLVLSM